MAPVEMPPTALAWAQAALGTPVTIEPMKARPWATTWCLRGEDGQVWYLKTTVPTTRYEVPLMTALAQTVPELVPAVPAHETTHGWLLLADAGPLLSDQDDQNDQNSPAAPAAWPAMMARFARLQRAVEPEVNALLAVGVPDERPARLIGVLHQLLEKSTQLTELTTAERRALTSDSARWREDLAAIGELPLPASVQHGDLHPGNVGVKTGIDTGSAIRFFDFGDASIAHPFCTLEVPLRVARHRGADEAMIDRIRNSYLDEFTDLAPIDDLRRLAARMTRISPLTRATSWDRALVAAGPDHEWGDPVTEWLRDMLV
jgi:hypothetical protein